MDGLIKISADAVFLSRPGADPDKPDDWGNVQHFDVWGELTLSELTRLLRRGRSEGNAPPERRGVAVQDLRREDVVVSRRGSLDLYTAHIRTRVQGLVLKAGYRAVIVRASRAQWAVAAGHDVGVVNLSSCCATGRGGSVSQI